MIADLPSLRQLDLQELTVNDKRAAGLEVESGSEEEEEEEEEGEDTAGAGEPRGNFNISTECLN